MSKTYPSKVSYGMLLLITLVFFVPFVPNVMEGDWSAGLIITGIILLFLYVIILYMFLGTRYHIEGNLLKVTIGALLYRPIEINDIKEVANTKSLLSSPAPSLDRIVVKYGVSNAIILSPDDKIGFANHLKDINPDIIINLEASDG